MKRIAFFFFVALLLFFTLSAHGEAADQSPEADTVYELAPLIELSDGEEMALTTPSSYYSGAPVYKGTSSQLLTGACALHCASVVITNIKGDAVTAQEVTKANNISKVSSKYWVAFVAWGKLESAFGVRFQSFDMAQYSARLKARGIKADERRTDKINTLCAALDENAAGVGLIVHFNSTGQLNGSGKRHAVVVLGYVKKDGQVTDLLIGDSSVQASRGACVRLSESSLPLSMLGKKKLAKADKSTLALTMMDYVVSYRYVSLKESAQKDAAN